LSGPKLDHLLDKTGASQVAVEHSANSLLVEQLALLEADNRHVIYQADSGDSAWTKRSVRQADHILLVGRGSANPEPAAIERSVQDTAAESRGTHTTLVLLTMGRGCLPEPRNGWRRGTWTDTSTCGWMAKRITGVWLACSRAMPWV
jgi:hypothetical protein